MTPTTTPEAIPAPKTLPTHLAIPAPLAKALAERDYTDLTPVQMAVLAPEAAERDLLVSAQTGSGKTVAFGISIASTLLLGDFRMEPAAEPLALIVAPTRELALQVQRELEWLYAPTGARVVACVGGMDPRRERRLLDAGAHIVVGTPGRLKDHIERKALILSDIRAIVLDEADEMLDLGFRDDLEFILGTTPETRRTLLFSATLPRGIVALAGKFQKDAFRIAAAGGDRGHADIEYRALQVSQREIEHSIINVLRQVDSPAALIFCNTRDGVRHLQATLVERGFSAVYLSGELSQNERNQSLQALRDGRAKVCVATDVAARGIDLPNLGLVIHADLPLNAEILQHRSGRTGRAGRKGISVLVVPPARRRKAERLIGEAKLRPIWVDPPTAEEIRVLDRQRFLQDPLLTEEASEEDLAMAELLLKERPAVEIAAVLARLYRSRLPQPEEVSAPGQYNAPRNDRGQERGNDRGNDRGSDRGNSRGQERAHERSQDRGRGNMREDREPRPVSGRFERDPQPLVAQGDSLIFRMEIGRNQKADPKWLLPMICRRGNVTRQEIGTIRIFDDTTEFEINKEAAEHFAVHAQRKDKDDILILPASAPKAASSPRQEKKVFKPEGKPFKPKQDYAAKPAYADTRESAPKTAYEDRPPYSDKSANSDKPAFSGKPSYGAKASYGDKPAYAGKREFAPKVAYEDRPPYSDKPPVDRSASDAPRAGKPTYGKPAFGKRPDQPSGKKFGGSSKFGGGSKFGSGEKGSSRSGFAHRKKGD